MHGFMFGSVHTLFGLNSAQLRPDEADWDGC